MWAPSTTHRTKRKSNKRHRRRSPETFPILLFLTSLSFPREHSYSWFLGEREGSTVSSHCECLRVRSFSKTSSCLSRLEGRQKRKPNEPWGSFTRYHCQGDDVNRVWTRKRYSLEGRPERKRSGEISIVVDKRNESQKATRNTCGTLWENSFGHLDNNCYDLKMSWNFPFYLLL